ncbi:hypothetical protein QZH41_014266 [Actinostola sp. cb2023]|nr:hypothetical protein QZH41_014266 [Actinostola sp. cb2023]
MLCLYKSLLFVINGKLSGLERHGKVNVIGVLRMAKYVTASNVARLHLHKEDNISTTDVLRALKAYNTAIIGAQSSYKGQAIDVVCASEETAAEIATHGIDHEDRHYNLRVALKPRIHVSVFVPIGMPDEVLATLMARYGNVQKTRRLHHKDEDLSHYENGVRVIEFDALTQPIPSRVSFAGINIGFKYTGQPKTCVSVTSTASPQPSLPAVNESTPTVDPTDLPFGSASDNDSDAEEVSEDEETKSERTNARLAADNNTDKTLQPMDPTPPKLGIKRALLQSPTKPTTKKLISTQSQFELSLQDIHCPSQFFSVKLAAVTKAHSYHIQLHHGDFTDEKNKTFRLHEQPQLAKTWRKLKNKSHDDIKDLLTKLYQSHFEGKI